MEVEHNRIIQRRREEFITFKKATDKRPFQLPATEEDIYNFCLWAGRTNKQVEEHNITSKTISRYLFAIKAWHIYHNKTYPERAQTKVNLMLRSSAYVDTSLPAKTAKAAILIPHLILLAKNLDARNNLHRAVFHLSLVAFWGMARLIELTYETPSGQPNPLNSLLCSDLRFSQSKEGRTTAVLSIRGAKTASPGETQIIKVKAIGGPLCPILAIQRRMTDAGKKTHALFGYWEKGQRFNLTRSTATNLVKLTLTKCGQKGISGHSFRVGGASLCYAIGVPPKEICRLGCWTSECYKLYLRTYLSSNKDFAPKFLSKPDNLYKKKKKRRERCSNNK
ncbi:hypothetical protein MJO28_000849 [Puccinia striiformis f. sp. tritici]|uniref:Uncharacterized protein n=1 Tax=Puccinia striiformis f. sp. tritici TaxID=168172 RepID=A0ACC0F0Q7_9BASI|nr:hypothetical protein MJO28_000849 [Puccinia striiformis f. sp. tritici]